MNNTTDIGNKAEELATQYLIGQGHKIIDRNVRTRFYELDIISTIDDFIVLTEVKYRKNDSRGGGLGAINADKINRLSRGFEAWLSESLSFQNYQPRIDVISIDQKSDIDHIENVID